MSARSALSVLSGAESIAIANVAPHLRHEPIPATVDLMQRGHRTISCSALPYHVSFAQIGRVRSRHMKFSRWLLRYYNAPASLFATFKYPCQSSELLAASVICSPINESPIGSPRNPTQGSAVTLRLYTIVYSL